MTIVINLGLHGGRIGGIFITGIFGNFYTKRGRIFDFQNGNSRWPWTKAPPDKNPPAPDTQQAATYSIAAVAGN